jgi:hypothetical protein
MAKVLGYVLATIGLVIMALSFVLSSIPLLSSVKPIVVMFIGIILIIVGVALSMGSGSSSNKIKQAADEVPIYEGEGKKRRIVGYKRAK